MEPQNPQPTPGFTPPNPNQDPAQYQQQGNVVQPQGYPQQPAQPQPAQPGIVQPQATQPAQTPWQQTPQPQPSQPSFSNIPASSPKSRMGVMIAGGAVLLVAIAAGAFFTLKGNDSSGNQTAKQATSKSSQSAAANAKELSSLSHVTFNQPSDMSDFKVQGGDGGRQLYAQQGTPSDQSCSLAYGVYTEAQLPGADIDAILKPQLDALRQAGLTVEGPTAGQALNLKGTDGATYSMPTLHFTVTKGSLQEVDHYSLAILASGERAYISRACVNRSGTVNPSMFDKVDGTAKKFTVTAN